MTTTHPDFPVRPSAPLRRLRWQLLFFGLLSMCAIFDCPQPVDPGSGPPGDPAIDSICVGVNEKGQEGVWVHFHPEDEDTGKVGSYTLYRGVMRDTVLTYSLLFDQIGRNLRQVFDGDVEFMSHSASGALDPPNLFRYRMSAQGKSYANATSDTSAADSIALCRQARLLYPVGDTLASDPEFSWSILGMPSGYETYIGVGRGDTLFWEQRAEDVFVDPYIWREGFLRYNEDGTAQASRLANGDYLWWVRIVWNGSSPVSHSLKTSPFRILRD